MIARARFAGTTKYPLRKMINLAMDGIFSFSTVPLRSITVLGALTSAVASVGLLYSLVMRLFTPHWVTGWTTVIIAILLVSGVQMVCFGVLGEYIGRIYTEIKQRPLFLVREMLELGNRAEHYQRPAVAIHAMARNEWLRTA
jgi:polyisoprenyl-phosphate glycosyltransferase